MRLIGRSFGGSAVSNDGDVSDAETALTCDSCGREVDENDIEEGQCAECYNSEYTGPKYCCGGIYENGEDTCWSCGEPL